MNNEISLEQAVTMTTRFREQLQKIINPDLGDKNILPRCETFDRAIFDKILLQNGCVKVRIYAGLDIDLQRHSIIVGVNEKDEDILPAATGTEGPGEGGIGEDAIVCPPICPPPSPLNP